MNLKLGGEFWLEIKIWKSLAYFFQGMLSTWLQPRIRPTVGFNQGCSFGSGDQ